MTLLVIRLAFAHVRSSPGDLLAVAVLLAAAALVPGAPNDVPVAGLALSGVVAAGATAAALANHYEQRRMLRRNGAGPWLVASVATLAVLIPGSLAAAALLAIGTATGAALDAASVLAICLGVPAVTALLLALSVASREASYWPAKRRRLTGAISGVAKAVSLLLALAIAVGLGLSDTWFGLALLLFFAGPVLVLAIAVLGATWTDLLGRHAGTAGPLVLLAVGPLRRRRGLLLPLTAVLSVVVSFAAVEGVVGASFGEREERRLASLSSVQVEEGDVAPSLPTFEFGLPVVMGDELVDVSPSGAYNEVPFLAGTREEASQRMLSLGLLAVLVTLAGTVLALGSTRSQDHLLEMQGATVWLRARIGGLQAAVLSGAAAAFAAVVGIGLPSLSFAVYNGVARGELPMIPLMVPAEVLAGLVLLPLVAGGLATGLVAVRHQRRSLSVPAPG